MSITTGATDFVGGGYPTAYAGGFGGFGGIAPIGLIGLNTFLGRGFGNDFDGRGGMAGTTVLEQNVSELRKDVQSVNTQVESLGNELQGAIFAQTSGQTAQFNQIADLIMSSSKENALLAKDAVIANMVNTQSIKDQAANFQVVNQENFCSIKELVHADGDATRALINANRIEELRDQLAAERRGRDNREIEINVQNNATQTQNVLQQQQQQQTQYLSTLLSSLGDQVNRATNSVINVGSGLVAGSQTNSSANTKVN